MSSFKSRKELFVCDCGDLDHQFVVQWMSDYPDEDDKEIFITVHLSQSYSFWKKLKAAFRYLFSKDRSRFGDFDEIILDLEEANRLKNVINNWINEVSMRKSNGN